MIHRIATAALVVLLLALGCERAPSAGVSQSLASKPHPTSVAQAEALKRDGASWTNEEVRLYYNQVVAAIGPANEQWTRDGLAADERARRAFQIRHDARLFCRAMMSDPREVDDLRRRDQDKYGHPDGPTFDELVESGRKKGTTGDALFEDIVKSAQHTDEKTNAALGVPSKP